MTPETVLTLVRHALETMLLTSAPMLITILVIGLAVSLFQALTQINEQTLSFVPKLVASVVVMIVAGPWVLSTLSTFVANALISIPGIIDGRVLP